MRFPHARWTQKNHVAGFVNESQRTQLPNLPIIQRWLKTEIELFEGFHKGEMRQLQSRPQIPSPSCFHLAAQQLIEKVRVARLFLRRLFEQVPGKRCLAMDLDRDARDCAQTCFVSTGSGAPAASVVLAPPSFRRSLT